MKGAGASRLMLITINHCREKRGGDERFDTSLKWMQDVDSRCLLSLEYKELVEL